MLELEDISVSFLGEMNDFFFFKLALLIKVIVQTGMAEWLYGGRIQLVGTVCRLVERRTFLSMPRQIE